jgi:endoglucanase
MNGQKIRFKSKREYLPIIRLSFLLILIALYFSGCALYSNRSMNYKESVLAFQQNKLLGRGVNLGNALDAPEEGAWGVTLKEEYFQLIKDAGFNSVRIPVHWSAHALSEEPYTIDPLFFQRVDWAVENALSRGLLVVLNIHQYVELTERPIEYKQRYLSLWKQISEHYKDYPDTLLFEFLNEPCKNLKSEQWNQFIIDTLKIVRQSNPSRTVVIGPVNYNNLHYLAELKLPDEERNVIVTYHYYEPFHFTHQGASWAGDQSDGWLGMKWTGRLRERNAVVGDFNQVLKWARTNNRPIYMGEFGAYSKADMTSRALWTEFVAREAERRGFSWAYWEFCSGFGVYDQSRSDWNDELLKALIPFEITNKLRGRGGEKGYEFVQEKT